MIENAEHIMMRDTLVECGRIMCDMTEQEFLHTRKIPAPLVRSVCYKLMHEKGMNAKEIGRLFGKDRCTIMSANNRLAGFERIGDKFSKQIYNELKLKLT